VSGTLPSDGPKLDPAVALEQLRGSPAYPPGFYGTVRRRLPIFALVGALSVLLGLLPFPHNRTLEVLADGAMFFALTLAAVLVPWRRAPQWFWPVIPVGYIAVVALLSDAQGGYRSGLSALYLLPVVWLALYDRRSHLVVGLAAMALALLVPMALVGAPAYPPADWRIVVVLLVVATLVSSTVLTMVARDRAYVADLAEQSLFAQQNARDALAAREQLDSLLQAATETAIIGTDTEGLVTFFSAGAEHMMGYRAEEVIGTRTVYSLIDSAEGASRANQIRSLVEAVSTVPTAPLSTEGEVWTYVRRDGTMRRATVAMTSRSDGDRKVGYVFVASDVTQREELAADRERLLSAQREVTESLVEQNRRLRELTKMKDDVVATVSHELRTPLTSIRGFVELLLEVAGPSLDAEEVRMLRTIDRNSLQLLRVAEDLLSDPGAANGLRVTFVDTDLTQVAREAIEAMAGQAGDHRLDLEIGAGPTAIVHGDRDRLHQLLGNLLANAIKFTPAGGRIKVAVDTVGDFARLSVLDQGPGIPPSERPQLFERFYRLASATSEGIPGTGLGLAIAKSVAEAHEGTVDIVDTPGWSTTFRVLLPLASARHQRAIPA
jgi:PAS domain S-box-containing protein